VTPVEKAWGPDYLRLGIVASQPHHDSRDQSATTDRSDHNIKALTGDLIADRRIAFDHECVIVRACEIRVRHFGGETLAAYIAFEGCPHFDHVEVHGASGDRLLQACVVVSLCEVDPVDGRSGVVGPGLGQAAEQYVVNILVVEAHERQFDALELAFLHVGLGRAQAHFADFLPVGIGRLSSADARNLQDSCTQIVLREGFSYRQQRWANGGHGRGGRGTLEHRAAAQQIVEIDFHSLDPPIRRPVNWVSLQ